MQNLPRVLLVEDDRSIASALSQAQPFTGLKMTITKLFYWI